VAYAKLFLGGAILFWIGGGLLFGTRWLRPGNAFLTIAIIHLGLNWIIAYAASRRLAEERLTGGFEVLLTTPLGCGEIVQGQIHALIVQFRTILPFVVLMDLIFFLAAFLARPVEPLTLLAGLFLWAMLVAYCLAVHLDTASLSMWIAAWTGRAGYAALQAVRGQLGVVGWMGVCLVGGALAPGRQGWILIALLIIPTAVATLARRRKLREKLSRELRLIAVAPVPARNDRRFKSWNPEEIYPPGRWGELLLRPAQSLGRHRAAPRPIPGPRRRG
jgi:MFS family permease